MSPGDGFQPPVRVNRPFGQQLGLTTRFGSAVVRVKLRASGFETSSLSSRYVRFGSVKDGQRQLDSVQISRFG
ncbi:hypothetical protein Hanom_Chr12g01162221 [Helianthus anomalus]